MAMSRMIMRDSKIKGGKEKGKASKRKVVNKMWNKCPIKRKMVKWGKVGTAGMLTLIKNKNKTQGRIKMKN